MILALGRLLYVAVASAGAPFAAGPMAAGWVVRIPRRHWWRVLSVSRFWALGWQGGSSRSCATAADQLLIIPPTYCKLLIYALPSTPRFAQPSTGVV